jgi:OFA family oxalate/formate antiporter-like MFS transporter
MEDGQHFVPLLLEGESLFAGHILM